MHPESVHSGALRNPVLQKKSFEIGIRGVDPDIAPDFSTVHYEFALGIAIRNLIAGSATPQEAAAMAQAIYDAPSAPGKSI